MPYPLDDLDAVIDAVHTEYRSPCHCIIEHLDPGTTSGGDDRHASGYRGDQCTLGGRQRDEERTVRKIADRGVTKSKRVWFADGRSYNYGTQYCHIYSSYKASDFSQGGTDFARFAPVHNGRGNMACWDGHVASTDADSMRNYYHTYIFGRGTNWAHVSVSLFYYSSDEVTPAKEGGVGHMTPYL